MPGNIFPQNGFRMSEATLRKNMGLSPLYEFLRMYASDDRVVLNNIPGINNFPIAMGAYWTPANSAGTSAANFASVVGAGPGYIQGDTGTDDDGSISLIGPIIYDGDHNAGCMFDIQIDAVTDYNLELGFIDAVPGSNAGGITDIDTPNIAAADAALLAIDTDQTLTTLAFATDGSTANMDDKATTIAAPITNFTAATRHRVVVQLFGNFAYCAIDGVVAAVHDASVDAQGCIEGGTLLAPWIYCRTRTTTARFPRLYNFAIWQDWR
jgi:hypothetical protein